MRQPRYVVATDLSPASRNALAQAVALARRTGASVDLFCAVPENIVDEEKRLLGRVREGLEKLASRTAAQGVATSCEVVVSKDVPKSIAAHASAVGADLVAVGPSGVTGWKKFVLGSVTERMLRLVPATLLVARGRLPEPPATILAAIDMTPGSTRALHTALDLARAFGAKLVALHAVAPPGAALMAAGDVYLPETWTLEAERVAAAQREFGAWIKAFPKDGVEVEARVVEGNPAEVVVSEAKACGASLVVVGSHGKTAVHEFFVGSVARGVATHSPVSVLVVRARPPLRGGAAPSERRRTKTGAKREPAP
jgi:nucleotide-binding universal stress UspA family protein